MSSSRKCEGVLPGEDTRVATPSNAGQSVSWLTGYQELQLSSEYDTVSQMAGRAMVDMFFASEDVFRDVRVEVAQGRVL